VQTAAAAAAFQQYKLGEYTSNYAAYNQN